MRNCMICGNMNFSKIARCVLSQPDDSILDSNIQVVYCNNCIFYFLLSRSTQDDYNRYYLTNNNYTNLIYHESDVYSKSYNFLINNLDINVKTVIDYGCGNGTLSNHLENSYNVTRYDIGSPLPSNMYDCLVLSHVLEHIYDPLDFIKQISKYISSHGYIYIEVPNQENYHKLNDFGPLQEINLEHINYFSRYALTKLMIQSGFVPIMVKDDYFTMHSKKYYVIRSIFQKNANNMSLEQYISDGFQYIDNLIDKLPNIDGRIFLYGCGQLLYKLINKLQQKYNIIYIIDNNLNLKNKSINSIKIITLQEYVNIQEDSDTIIITSKQYSDAMTIDINKINSKIKIITC